MKIIPEKIFKEILLSGVNEFMYLSYDHKAAMKHAISMGTKVDGNGEWHYLPKELTNKFPLWRKGKLWIISFNPDGTIKKVYISKFLKYMKVFYPHQFGVDIKPIIHEFEDTHNLIKNDLAKIWTPNS